MSENPPSDKPESSPADKEKSVSDIDTSPVTAEVSADDVEARNKIVNAMKFRAKVKHVTPSGKMVDTSSHDSGHGHHTSLLGGAWGVTKGLFGVFFAQLFDGIKKISAMAGGGGGGGHAPKKASGGHGGGGGGHH